AGAEDAAGTGAGAAELVAGSGRDVALPISGGDAGPDAPVVLGVGAVAPVGGVTVLSHAASSSTRQAMRASDLMRSGTLSLARRRWNEPRHLRSTGSGVGVEPEVHHAVRERRRQGDEGDRERDDRERRVVRWRWARASRLAERWDAVRARHARILG